VRESGVSRSVLCDCGKNRICAGEAVAGSSSLMTCPRKKGAVSNLDISFRGSKPEGFVTINDIRLTKATSENLIDAGVNSMIKSINKIFLMLFLLTSMAAICAAQSWDEGGSDWTNDGGSGNGGESNQNIDSWGTPTPAEVSEPSDEAYFPRSISEDSSTLNTETSSYQYAPVNAPASDLGGTAYYAMGGGGSSQNIFWIVSKDGTKHWISANIPCQRYARLLIIPSTSGQLIMEELYPNGRVQTYNYGNVRASNQYRKWFFADTSGIHRLRYRIDNGPYSDILTFHVVGNCRGGSGGSGFNICPCCGRPL
jgi:hypothetical protein